MSDTVLLLCDDAMVEHDPGRGHPESPARLRAITQRLREHPIAGTRWASPQPAERGAIARVHAPGLLAQLEDLRGRTGGVDPDTWVSPGSLPAAALAAGAAIDATTAVVEGHARAAVSLVRPPGHHAETDRAMGFCLHNNVAIAAAHALDALGCRRVLVVDWDVHHGNGTQQVFYGRDDVLFVSAHQYPMYPGTGALAETGRGAGEGYSVNLPLPAGMGDADYLAIFADVLPPLVEQYAPDLILVSAGFDAHRADPLGGMAVSDDGFAALCGLVRDLADRHAGGRLVLALEGGYDLDALARSVHGCVQVLCGATPPQPRAGATPGAGVRTLHEIRAHHGRHWKL